MIDNTDIITKENDTLKALTDAMRTRNDVLTKQNDALIKEIKKITLLADAMIEENDALKKQNDAIIQSFDTMKVQFENKTAQRKIQIEKSALKNRLITVAGEKSGVEFYYKNIPDRLVEILLFMYDNAGARFFDMQKNLSVSRVTIQRDFTMLRKMGWIRLNASKLYELFILTEEGTREIESIARNAIA